MSTTNLLVEDAMANPPDENLEGLVNVPILDPELSSREDVEFALFVDVLSTLLHVPLTYAINDRGEKWIAFCDPWDESAEARDAITVSYWLFEGRRAAWRRLVDAR